MTFEILCVSPYEGLNNLMQSLCHPYSETGALYNFTFLRYDLHDDAAILQAKLDMHPWDLIISRGGTAAMIRSRSTAPIIDIGLSQYDLLNVIQSTQHLNHAALVAYANISENTRQLINGDRARLPLYSVEKPTDLPPLFAQLHTLDINTIICDAGIEPRAKESHFNTLLITSSRESVSQALTHGLMLLESQEHNLSLINTLKQYLSLQKKDVVLINADYRQIFSTGLPSQDKSLAQTMFSTWRRKNRFIEYQGNHYELDVCTPSDGYIALTLHHFIRPTAEKLLMDIDTPGIGNAFEQYFRTIQDESFFTTLKNLSKSHQPVMLIGENGTGKMYVVSLLHRTSLYTDRQPIFIDSSDHSTLRTLLSDDGSALYDSGQMIVIKDYNFASAVDQQTLFDFVTQTRLFDRNLVVFTLTQAATDGLTTCQRQLMHHARTLILPPLRQVTGEHLSAVLTSIINEYNRKQGSNIIDIADMALDSLLQAPWPGNFSQFYRLVNQALTATDGAQLKPQAIRFAFSQADAQMQLQVHSVAHKDSTITQVQPLNTIIHNAVVDALDHNNGKRALTAEQLGISRATLWRYLKHD
ncbi:PrpR N-terminal domain-containing protein [Lacticaseibacillus sp. GG6-2]